MLPSSVSECLSGTISPQVAVARLLLAGHDPAAILALLDMAPPGPPIAAMRALVSSRTDALQDLSDQVNRTAFGHDASGSTPAEGVARIAAFFDGAVRHSPEASVALYSLGDPELLAEATADIVAWLADQRLLPEDADVLDLGCGIGRVCAALAPRCRSVLGLDVSPGMVAEAARRLAGLDNVRLALTSGEDLDGLTPESLDLLLAIDIFPYVVQMGPETAFRHLQGAARALRPGGALCILNLSYRGDEAADQADAARWSAECGFTLGPAGVRPFRMWDGNAYVFRR